MDGEIEGSQRPLTMARAVWAAFLSTPVLLTLVAWVVLSGGSEDAAVPALDDPLVLAFLGVGVVFFVVAIRIEGILNGTRARVDQGSQQESDRQALGFYIVRLAMLELVVILGFVVAVLKGSAVMIVPFFLLSLFGFAVSFPGTSFLKR